MSTTMLAAPASSSPATAGPWTRGRVVGFGAVQAGALAVILAGWYTAAGQHSSSEVWPWLAVCLTGFALSAAANGVAFFGGRRAIIRRPLPALDSAGLAVAVPGGKAGSGRPTITGLVSGTGMTLFHRPDCLLVAGKAVETADRAAHERAGRQACGMCEP